MAAFLPWCVEGKAGDSGPAAVAGPGPLLSLHRAGASRVDGQ